MKNRKKILYISTNDGSDMRINKEIKSLHMHFEVIFIGMGLTNENCYIKDLCKEIYIVIGSKKNLFTFLKHFFIVIKALLKHKINSIHLINEKLVLIYYPILFFKYSVLDLFDSVFLLSNMSKNKGLLLKLFIYAPINKIIVTDKNRYDLMPNILKRRLLILPNYPNKMIATSKKTASKNLRIMYFGWMGLGRGTEIVEGLISIDPNIKVYMAGWFSDKYTEQIIQKYPLQIEYLGVIKQNKALDFSSKNADYILCVYRPTNDNNINASPNKIYDAISIDTPIIINSEVKISSWVIENKLGYVIDEYLVSDFMKLKIDLQDFKHSYVPPKLLKDELNWENCQEILWEAHK